MRQVRQRRRSRQPATGLFVLRTPISSCRMIPSLKRTYRSQDPKCGRSASAPPINTGSSCGRAAISGGGSHPSDGGRVPSSDVAGSTFNDAVFMHGRRQAATPSAFYKSVLAWNGRMEPDATGWHRAASARTRLCGDSRSPRQHLTISRVNGTEDGNITQITSHTDASCVHHDASNRVRWPGQHRAHGRLAYDAGGIWRRSPIPKTR